jgi:hypothetical protein
MHRVCAIVSLAIRVQTGQDPRTSKEPRTQQAVMRVRLLRARLLYENALSSLLQ